MTNTKKKKGDLCLKYCKVCNQMTNHRNGKCCKHNLEVI